MHSVYTGTYIFVILTILSIGVCNRNNDTRVLSRRKRHLVFPEGSTLSAALCVTVQTFLQPQELWTEAINWVVAYDLPTKTEDIKLFKSHALGLQKQRQFRRDLYRKMETAVDNMGLNGRACIYRTLCEAAHYFKESNENNYLGEDLLESILRLIFLFPHQNMHQTEHNDNKHFSEAKKLGMHSNDIIQCEVTYKDCSISFLSYIFNYFDGFKTGQSTIFM